eukprot:1484801-Alexandrium_andersonii.AAC.1
MPPPHPERKCECQKTATAESQKVSTPLTNFAGFDWLTFWGRGGGGLRRRTGQVQMPEDSYCREQKSVNDL